MNECNDDIIISLLSQVEIMKLEAIGILANYFYLEDTKLGKALRDELKKQINASVCFELDIPLELVNRLINL